MGLECLFANAVHTVPPNKRCAVRLVKLTGDDGPVYINPEHVVAVRKALRDTRVETVNAQFTVKEEPPVVVRLLGAEELAIDVTPALVNMSAR